MALQKCSDPLLELHCSTASAKRGSGNHNGYRGLVSTGTAVLRPGSGTTCDTLAQSQCPLFLMFQS